MKVMQPFTIIPNSIIQNRDLSIQARGLCAYILSLPKTWKISIENLCSELGMSRNTLYKYLKELINAGILEKVRLRDDKGRFSDEAIYYLDSLDDKTLLKSISPLNKICDVDKMPRNRESEKETYDESEILSTSQNLNTINKEYINIQKEKNIKKEKEKTFYLLQTNEQKRLLSLCFLKEPKKLDIDLSHLSANLSKAFNDFISYRAERGKVPIATQKAILDKINRWKDENFSDETIIQSINQSIERGYKGLFLPSYDIRFNARETLLKSESPNTKHKTLDSIKL